jgi:hypothetical protein
MGIVLCLLWYGLREIGASREDLRLVASFSIHLTLSCQYTRTIPHLNKSHSNRVCSECTTKYQQSNELNVTQREVQQTEGVDLVLRSIF